MEIRPRPRPDGMRSAKVEPARGDCMASTFWRVACIRSERLSLDYALLRLSVAALCICCFWQENGESLPYAVGGGAAIAAILLPRVRWNVEQVSSCMPGVYLVHIAVLGVFNRIIGPGTFLTTALAFPGSFAGVWLVRRFVPAGRLVLG